MRLNRIFITCAKFTSIVKICMIMIGVKIKEINGNTLEIVHRSLMWLAKRITIAIITKTVIAKIIVSSYRQFWRGNFQSSSRQPSEFVCRAKFFENFYLQILMFKISILLTDIDHGSVNVILRIITFGVFCEFVACREEFLNYFTVFPTNSLIDFSSIFLALVISTIFEVVKLTISIVQFSL